jgi:hypothetical protein
MSQPQHIEALQFANEIRFAHFEIRKQIKAGTITFREAIDLPHGDRLPVWRILHRIQQRWSTPGIPSMQGRVARAGWITVTSPGPSAEAGTQEDEL